MFCWEEEKGTFTLWGRLRGSVLGLGLGRGGLASTAPWPTPVCTGSSASFSLGVEPHLDSKRKSPDPAAGMGKWGGGQSLPVPKVPQKRTAALTLTLTVKSVILPAEHPQIGPELPSSILAAVG